MARATSEEAKESASVGVLQEQLRALQADVDAASRRLAVTRARVEMNMKRVDDLKAEAVSTDVSHDDSRLTTGFGYSAVSVCLS